MPRPLRLIEPQSWHHLTHRGADRQDVFSDDRDHLHYEFLLAEIEDRFGVEVHAFCLMTNHVHLLVRCVGTDLSRAMQHLASTYAGRYNHRHQRTGPLFGGRFHSTPIESNDQLVIASRYLHRNALSIVEPSALAAYRWSSLGVYLDRRERPDWLHCDEVLTVFGRSREAYEDFVTRPLASDRTLAPSTLRTTAAEVEWAVAATAGVDPVDLKRTRRGVLNRPRLLAIWMTTSLRLETSEAMAARYGFSSPSGVRNAARRARVLLADDAEMGRLRDRVERLLRSAA